MHILNIETIWSSIESQENEVKKGPTIQISEDRQKIPFVKDKQRCIQEECKEIKTQQNKDVFRKKIKRLKEKKTSNRKWFFESIK